MFPDLSPWKIAFTSTRLQYEDNDSGKPLREPKLHDIQPVDEVGNVLPIHGSNLTVQLPKYLVSSSWHRGYS